ncbi:MAG: cysteine--tRNA ligase [Parasporobacterium sp.]|nr:cysteine--tRNA ligase [Parasporobacterium sp.]
MRIYNTLNARKEELVPIQEGKIGMYVCGPTVYNLIHIGNARPMIVFDTFRRYLEYKGYDVTYVSNFTDVDDKIIKRSVEEGISAQEVAEKYIEECRKDMASLNIRPATVAPQATLEIPGMLEMIKTLIEKGYAYEKNGTVYYRTRKFRDYGKLSNKNLDDMQSGHRDIKVTGEDEKEDPADFVLWKPKKEGEPSWPSPWSDGRPGWHIECSVMAKRYLGDTIDIHAGGEDLIFPHHENEIAQSEAANGVPFSHYWMHNAFLNIDGSKMSKSAGNFFTVRDIIAKYDPQVLRFFMLSAHYRSPLNFSDTLMDAAKSGLERIKNAAANLDYILANPGQRPQEFLPEEDSQFAAPYIEKFESAMDDDCNTADAIAAVFELVRTINSLVKDTSSVAFVKTAREKLGILCDVLGIILEEPKDELEAEIEELIAERQAARKAKNFQRADEIRSQLDEMGIVLEDTREGVKWHRK